MKQEAAVLIPVYRAATDGLRLVLVRRSEVGVHGGQIAFPGGKPEPGDASMRETALRETREEIGLEPESLEILEALPIFDTLTSGYRVFPFLARVTPPGRWRPDPAEIAEVLEVDVADLMRPETRGEELMSFPSWPGPRQVPYFRIGPWRLWGLTYRILEPLLPRLEAGEWGL